jgi:phospholipid/cholesterol/gamma-HCH transport system substrate-binding protein
VGRFLLLRHSRQIGRVAAIAALLVAIAVVAVLLLRGGDAGYSVVATFDNASQLVRGNDVQVAGKRVGEVTEIELTSRGAAAVTLDIADTDYAPLRRGTQAVVRLTSLSGVANRYVDLRMPGGNPPEIPDGGQIGAEHTSSAVDLDQLINALDEEAQDDLQGVVQGFGRQWRGRSREAERGWLYLNPSLAASSRLFEELNRDTPALREFIGRTSDLVTTLSERREDVAGLVDDLANFTGAVSNRRESLADALEQLPPFMRRANSTFVNLRAAVDDLRPLVEETRPVTPRLRRLMAELRPFARDARPTLRDLSRTIRSPGRDNDLIDLTRLQPPLRNIAIGPVERNGAQRRGALPETVDALRQSIPQLAYARPYAVDLTGWFDDFGHSGLYDALGGKSRVGTYVNAFAEIEGVVRPIPIPLRESFGENVTASGQRNRCPGAAEHPADDGSNPWKPTPDHNCDPSQRLPGE